MTTAPTPSELLALRAGATQQIRLREKFGPEGLDLKLDPAIVIRLLDRIEDLQQQLVAEARATAEHKLRADQLAQQHRMQAQMHAQATQQLAGMEANKNARIHKLEMDALDLASENSILKRQDSELEAHAYRVLEAGKDIIGPDDEFLQEDATTWARDPGLIFVGMAYCRVLKPARRRITGGSS